MQEQTEAIGHIELSYWLCILDDYVSVCYVFSECSDRCGSCPRDNQTSCTTCQYLIDHDNNRKCLENTSCTMLGFEVGETGCGELLVTVKQMLLI